MENEKQEAPFYRMWHRPDHLVPGECIDLERRIEYNGWNVDRCDLPELVKLSPEELRARREGSAKAESAIFERIQAAVGEWETQGAQTMLLDRALEYVHTPEVTHTSNEWKELNGGIWEISNRVYKMRYTVQEETGGKRKGQWCAAWGIAINRPSRPKSEKYYFAGDVMVVEQKKKYYNAEAEARQYIKGRFDVYAHLFAELSPPIPDQYKRHFHINGILLPGYTVAPPERTAQEVASELLALLDDSDIEPSPGVGPEQPAPKSKVKGGPQKSKAAPVR